MPRAVAVVVLLALVSAACTTEAEGVEHHAAASRPTREVPPVERLGRWDGVTFAPLLPGSVTGGHLDVLVHGWERGYLDAVRRFRGRGPLLLWDPRAVDEHGTRAGTSSARLAAALTAADPRATVLAYSWLDDAATGTDLLDARDVAARADLDGERLAAALQEAEAPSFAARGGRVHLIGHGFGAKVATVAGIQLRAPPTQLTLLDSPEGAGPDLGGAANHLEGYLPLLPVGRRPGRTFVDNYFSLLGRRYGSFPGLGPVADVHLLPAPYPSGDVTGRHAYALTWYTASARDRGAGVGLAWSPMLGADPRGVPADSEQDWLRDGRADHARELELVARARPPSRSPIEHADVKLVPSTPAGAGVAAGAVLATGRRRVWQAEVSTAPGDLALEVDYRFVEPGDGDELTLSVDGRPRLASIGELVGATGQRAVLDVAALTAGRHTLTAVLSDRGLVPARVTLGGLRLERSRPAPARRPLSSGPRFGLLGLVALLFVVSVIVLLGTALRPGRRSPA